MPAGMALPLSVSGLDRLKFRQESHQGGQLRVEFRLGACGQQIFRSLLLFGRRPVVKIDEMQILDVWSGINEKAPSNDTAAVVVRLRGLLILGLLRRCMALAESLLSLR